LCDSIFQIRVIFTPLRTTLPVKLKGFGQQLDGMAAMRFLGPRRVIAVVVMVATIALGSVAGATAAAAHSCPSFRVSPGMFVGRFSVRSVSCRQASGLIRVGQGGPSGARRAGWTCVKLGYTDPTHEDTLYRCQEGVRAFRWAAGV
jgi:hypothetical protein